MEQRGSCHLVQAEAGVGLVPVVAHQQHEDEGRDAEDEAGEGDHDGRDDLLDPDDGGDDGVRLYGEDRGEVGVELVEPGDG